MLADGETDSSRIVHQDLLAFYSRYFACRFSDAWRETDEELTSTVPNTKPRVLDAFCHWLEKGSMPFKPDDHGTDKMLVELYVLADSIDCLALRRAVVDLVSVRTKKISHPASAVARKRLPPSSGLSRLLDYKWRQTRWKSIDTWLDSCWRRTCDFHEHKSEEERKNSKSFLLLRSERTLTLVMLACMHPLTGRPALLQRDWDSPPRDVLVAICEWD